MRLHFTSETGTRPPWSGTQGPRARVRGVGAAQDARGRASQARRTPLKARRFKIRAVHISHASAGTSYPVRKSTSVSFSGNDTAV